MKYLVPPIVIPVLLFIGILAYGILRPPIVDLPPAPAANSQTSIARHQALFAVRRHERPGPKAYRGAPMRPRCRLEPAERCGWPAVPLTLPPSVPHEDAIGSPCIGLGWDGSVLTGCRVSFSMSRR